MTDYDFHEHAVKVFESLCEYLDKKEVKYDADEENLIVRSGFTGSDLPMDIVFNISESVQLLSLYSKIPIVVPKEQMVPMAVAVCIASCDVVDGSFDYDMEKGELFFRITATFLDTDLGEGLLDYFLKHSLHCIEKYNDKFFALANGIMNINDFIEQTTGKC